jgi:two-component system chemotaxis response regulator CheY
MLKKILIVDDSATARNIIKRSIEICGIQDIEIGEAGNGKEALEILKANEYDLVFTDLNMPEMDGEQLIKRIKSSPKLFDIPVVVITSLANPVKEKNLLTEHASKIFPKPISLPQMREYLDEYLKEEDGEDDFEF